MGTKVLINSTSPNRVSINNQQRTTIKTVALPATQVQKLTDLTDIDASDADNNETLVYDSTLNKYVIKTLPGVDGGTF
jgi:hypothetical protein